VTRSAGSVSQQGLNLEQLNLIIHEYGESIRHFFRDQQRSSMVSPLFNIPGRMVLGAYCYYEHLAELLRYITEHASPEEIARGMKCPCNLPNYISINSLILGYLNGREQSRLLYGKVNDDLDDMATVLDFWSRTVSVYRNDGEWLPDAAGFTLPILSPGQVQDIASQLAIPDPTTRQGIRRMMATLELFTFILNGEARIGVFHHGPYPVGDGEFLIFKEMVGLQEDFYSWATPEIRLKYSSIARVLRMRNVKTKIVLMASLTTEPRSYEDSVSAEGVFLREGGELRPLPASDIAPVTTAAADAQLKLYRQMTDWDDRYRVAYGAELYGCILSTFAPEGRRDEFVRMIRSRFQETVDRHVDSLVSGKEQPLVLQHIAKTDGPIYAPVAQA
jgi:hypothetical protein